MQSIHIHGVLLTKNCLRNLLPVLRWLRDHTSHHLTLTCLLSDFAPELAREAFDFRPDLTLFQGFLEEAGPRIVLSATDYYHPAHRPVRDMVEIARAKGIPSLSVQHGYYRPGEMFHPDYHFSSDRVAVWGETMRGYMLNEIRGMTADRIVVTGCPRLDEGATCHQNIAGVERNRKLLGLMDGESYVLLPTQAHHLFQDIYRCDSVPVVAFYEALIRAVERHYPSSKLIIKPHPSEFISYWDTLSLLRDAVARSGHQNAMVLSDSVSESLDYFVLLAEAQFAVSCFSNLMIEALLVGTPFVVATTPDIPYHDTFDFLIDGHGARHVHASLSDLEDATARAIAGISAFRRDGSIFPEQRQAMDLLALDGRSAERVVRALELLVDDHQRGWRALIDREGLTPVVEQRPPITCSIVIPVHNDLAALEGCLDALIRNTLPDYFEVIIVDNASSDGSREFLARLEGDVLILRNDQNLGYAKACNQGAERAQGRYLLFMSPLSEPQPGWLDPLIKAMGENPDIAAVGSKLLLPNGRTMYAEVANGSGAFGGDGVTPPDCLSSYPFNYPLTNLLTEVPAVSGAALMIRPEALAEVGGFDESFWNGYEDVDLCFRLAEKGWRIVYEPRSRVVRHHSVSDAEERHAREVQNRALLFERWGEHIPSERSRALEGSERVASESDIPAKDHLARPRVLALLYYFEPCQLIRLAYPIQEAARQGLMEGKLINLFDKDLDADRLRAAIAWADVVVFQRYAYPKHLTLIDICKAMGKKVVFETDDDLLNLPPTNGAYSRFQDPAIRSALETLYREADLVTVSTQALAETYRGVNPNMRVIPNAIAEAAFPFAASVDLTQLQSGERVVIGYAGTSSHQDDLALVLPALVRLLDEHPDRVSLVFLGCIPAALRGHPAVTHVPETTDYEGFARTLRDSGIQIGLAPLVDHAFNRAKSPIKWMEYAACGIVTVASAVGPYREAIVDGEDGILVHEATSEAWYQALNRLVMDPSSRTRLATRAHAKVLTEHMVSVTANRWAEAYQIVVDQVERKRVSIIIPLYNQVDYTIQCLESLIQNTPDELNYEVILVDNASSDGTGAFLDQLSGDVVIHRNAENEGFAKACNQGARLAKGEILLFLNNDTIPHPGWLDGLLVALDTEPKVGAVGNKLLFPDGTIQHAGVIFNQNGSPGHWLYQTDLADDPIVNQRRDFQCVTAACIAIPRPVFEQVGGFDEGFRNGFEDVDLCLKIRKAGYRIVYTPESVVTHISSVSEGRKDHERANLQRLLDRWSEQVLPDARHFHAIAAGKTPRYSVVVVTYNSEATIRACLESVLATLGPDDEVLVVDNASSDHTSFLVASLAASDARLKFIPSADNLGFSAGSNLGLRRATGEYLVLLNPDTLVTPGWLERMCAHLVPGVGAVGPTSDYVAGLQKVSRYLPRSEREGCSPEAISEALQAKGHLAVDTKLLIGFCLMIPRSVFEEVGLLDPELFLGNDDLDLSWRLRQRGYRLLVATDVFVHHVGQVSFDSEPRERTKRLVQESTDLLARKLVSHYGPGNVPSPEEIWGIEWFNPSPGILDRPLAAELPDRRAFNIVLSDVDDERLVAQVRAYLFAFHEGDGVALHILAGERLEPIQARVLELLTELGRTPDAIPDISLLDAPTHPAELPAYLLAADLVLGSPDILRQANGLGVAALEDPTPKLLREVQKPVQVSKSTT